MDRDTSFLENALITFEDSLKAGEARGKSPHFWNDYGLALLKASDTADSPHLAELAIEKFDKAVNHPLGKSDPEFMELEWMYNLGCAYDFLGDWTNNPEHFEKAIQFLSHVLTVEPGYSIAKYNLALAYSHLAEVINDGETYQRAIQLFLSLIENGVEDESVFLDFGVSLINYAQLVGDLNHPEQSEALLTEAEVQLRHALSLGNSLAYYHLAGLYSLKGQFQMAMNYMERAKALGVLPPVVELLHDEWLEGLRGTPAFRQFISQLPGRQSRNNE